MRRLAALLVAFLPLVAGEARADGKETLDAARAAYYSLRREGLASFSCLVAPNWDMALASRWRTDPTATAKSFKTLSALTFGVEMVVGQRAKVMHTDPPAGGPDVSEKESQALKLVTSGVEQTLSGFFDIWGPFVVTSAVPPPTADVAAAHGLWIIDYKENKDGGTTSVGVVMRGDYTIETTRILTATFASVIQPQFVKYPKGLLMTAVQGSYRKLPSGPSSTVQMRWEYQDVNGFLLPKHLHASSNDGQRAAMMDMAFSTCQIQRR